MQHLKCDRGESAVSHRGTGSGLLYTMDHEVVPWQSKGPDWMMNSSRDNFGLH